VRALIRDDKAHQIYSIIQTGGKFGMHTMNQSLVELVTRGVITRDEAFNRTTDPDDLARSFEKRGMPSQTSNTRRITV
jgi:twitching motility protein PilT